jgi:hypothetical protein
MWLGIGGQRETRGSHSCHTGLLIPDLLKTNKISSGLPEMENRIGQVTARLIEQEADIGI